ncbi:MAG: DUF262 domain-containing protein [Oscillospiraceae bacterium]|nr:DUF262 domain-containing protein [Oscillospiraceae bacterium]
MFKFVDNKKSISEIYSMFKEGKLIVDETYQRRAVWGNRDKIRLIETILLNLVIPPLFFWKAETDPETGESITHIVDGQQRIKAIYDFIDDQYKLKRHDLLDLSAQNSYADKSFRELSASQKTDFWNYQLMVIDIDPGATRDDIITMFNRLNLTDYNLNDQEKRNSVSGEFAALAREISECTLWEDKKLFTNTDVKRMKDVEFCASLILLFRNGIIDQTDQGALNQAYDELQVGYEDAENDKSSVCRAIETIQSFFTNDEVSKFLRRKAQLYTLFSVIFYMQRQNIPLSHEYIYNFEQFVALYSVFNNDMDISSELHENEKNLFDLLKKYKLASSEGLNKHTNRMIRYNVMKKFLFDLDESTETARITLRTQMERHTENSMQLQLNLADGSIAE